MTGPVEHPPALTPELDVSDLDGSLAVYVGVFGFSELFRRPEERFAYLALESAHLMLQEAAGPGRRFRTAPLQRPYGRGVKLQIRVDDVDALRGRVRRSGLTMVVELEERWYPQGPVARGKRQFVTADPDGYLLRFFSDLGGRPID